MKDLYYYDTTSEDAENKKGYCFINIYERIFARLEELHMSQIELSRRTSIATSTISDWRKKKASYEQIKDYVLDHTGLKVSSLYIAQTKQKYGITERDCYNFSKSDNRKQSECPEHKEKAIVKALKHFKMVR